MSELYPIRLFKWRDEDDRRTEGRSEKELPGWVLSGKELKKHADLLREKLVGLVKPFFSNEGRNAEVPLVVAATLDAKRTSKTNRREIACLFGDVKSDALIGMQGNNRLMVKVNSKKHAEELRERLAKPETHAKAVSCISSLDGFTPTVEMAEVPDRKYKLKLIDFQDETCNRVVSKIVKKLIDDQHGTVCQYADRLKLYCVDGEHVKAVVDSLSADGLLYSCVPMPVYNVVCDSVGDGAAVVTALPRDSGRVYPRLGILDSGISNCPPLKPWVLGRSNPIYPEEYINRAHGTAVAGTAVYGDSLAGREWTGVRNGLDLFDGTVIPGNGETIYEDDLVSNIREVMEANHDVAPVWNLSLSVDRDICKDVVSDFGIALDEIQRKHNLLICKSAGNTDCFMRGERSSPLSVGADSYLSLVVGSVAHAKSGFDISGPGEASPFSRVGPGPEAIIKPEVVHYGGNAGVKSDGSMSTTGVQTITPDGKRIAMIGTSFSTPRVAAMAATLSQELGEMSNPLLLKALLVHSSRYSEGVKSSDPMTINGMGFGMPLVVNRILHDDADEATIVLCDELLQKHWVEILDFPMPKELSTNGFFDAQLVVSLVTCPILDATQGSEYCQSDIEVRLGSYAEKKARDTEKPSFLNPIGRDGAQNCLTRDFYSTRSMKRNAGFARERTLIEQLHKYCPVKKYSVDLSDATDRNKRDYLGIDRKWYLELKGVYRQHIESVAGDKAELLRQRFSLIVTIRDPKKRGVANSAVANLLRERSFVNEPIKIRSEARISYRG